MLTAEELREKRRREQWWRKVLAYYMMDTYVTKQDEKARAEAMTAYRAAERLVEERGLVNRLFKKRGNAPSAAELFLELGKDEQPDSPIGELAAELRKQQPSEEKLKSAVERVIVEEPVRMLEAERREQERRAEWRRTHPHYTDAAESETIELQRIARYEDRKGKKMSIFRELMPPEQFRELQALLAAQHRDIEAEERAAEQEQPQAQQRQTPTFAQYVEQKKLPAEVILEEKAGQLARSGEIYTAAAYMIAAYEQKDEKEFDAEKADLRAMQLSGSRAFKAYMKGHPGSLIAAAKGTAVAETRDGVAALDADLKRRDAILRETRDNLKKLATGKTPAFHRMLNALDRFVNEDTEPTPQERAGVVHALADYIATDCAQGSREFDDACFTQAMRSVKALVPEQDFAKVVEQVNVGREPKVKAEEFDAPAAAPKEKAPDAPERAPVLKAPQ
ncbi:MAG: hypothetical protein IJT71_00555 [Oscillospiraceae bacterium]|nr:hypothetical protein [Oscillospiraceae bacterium]